MFREFSDRVEHNVDKVEVVTKSSNAMSTVEQIGNILKTIRDLYSTSVGGRSERDVLVVVSIIQLLSISSNSINKR